MDNAFSHACSYNRSRFGCREWSALLFRRRRFNWTDWREFLQQRADLSALVTQSDRIRLDCDGSSVTSTVVNRITTHGLPSTQGLALVPRTRSYRTSAATWGDCAIPSDQFTPRMKGSGKTPITSVASAVEAAGWGPQDPSGLGLLESKTWRSAASKGQVELWAVAIDNAKMQETRSFSAMMFHF
jgi:hypothetical protein